MAVFWVVAPCSLVEAYQRFRGPCCFHQQGDRPIHIDDYFMLVKKVPGLRMIFKQELGHKFSFEYHNLHISVSICFWYDFNAEILNHIVE
jgi:hypothetical protein